MGDSSKSQTSNFYNILGIPKSASLSDICKAYKALVKKWHPDRHPTNRTEAQAKFSSINEAYRTLSLKKREEANAAAACDGDRKPKHKKKKSHDNDKAKEFQISGPTLLSRTTSAAVHSSTGDVSSPPVDGSGGRTPPTPTSTLPKAPSRRCTTPIFFSQSAARVKPPPIERKIECTLEELFLGCVKKIKITRDAILTSGYDSSRHYILRGRERSSFIQTRGQ